MDTAAVLAGSWAWWAALAVDAAAAVAAVTLTRRWARR